MANQFQVKFLERLAEKVGKKADVVNELAELLNRKKDGIYRRFKGETILSINELYEIVRHYKISINELLDEEVGHYLFSFDLSPQRMDIYNDYFKGLKADLEQFMTADHRHVYYAAQNLPLFPHMYFPRLTFFKFFIYGLTAWDIPESKDRKFSFDGMDEQFEMVSKLVAHQYSKIDSTELWTLTILDDTLNQIEFLNEIGQFSNSEDAILICDELLNMVNHMRKMAEYGKKFAPGEEPNEEDGQFELFFNEVAATNTTVVASNEIGKILFSALCHPSFLKTTNQQICDQIEQWLKELISHSTCISVHGNRWRSRYFNRLPKKIERTKLTIEQRIAVD